MPDKVVNDGNVLPFHAIYSGFLPHDNFVYQPDEQLPIEFLHAYISADKRNPLTDVVFDFL